MPQSSGGPAYQSLGRYYDEFFQGFRSPFDAARERVLGPLLPRVETACDLACGTGTTALALARAGIRTYAVDLSPAMCREARAKARRAGLPLRVLRGDMRSFRLPEPVDLITCEGDAVNHLRRKADLAGVARAVRRALRPGGQFYFDVNNARGFKRYWSGTVCFEKAGLVMVMRHGHTPGADRAWSDIDLFIRDGNRWLRRRDRVEEVCWDAAEIRRAFTGAGFDRVRAWDAAPFFTGAIDFRRPHLKRQLIAPGCRTIYLARKSAA